MSLKAQIQADIKVAMRAKDTARRNTLRNLSAAIKQVEVDERRALSDDDVEAILMKYAKQREDAKVQFAQGGRDDLVAQEEAELRIVHAYLPEPMDDAELTAILKTVITQTGASSLKDMGRIMGAAKAAVGRRADGGRIHRIAQKLLA